MLISIIDKIIYKVCLIINYFKFYNNGGKKNKQMFKIIFNS